MANTTKPENNSERKSNHRVLHRLPLKLSPVLTGRGRKVNDEDHPQYVAISRTAWAT